jgi:adenylate cyclase class IV
MNLSQKAMHLGRQVEILSARFDREAVLEVYETDADLTPGKLIYQGMHRDVAETKMCLAFRASGYEKDFLLYNRKTMDNEVLCLTNRTRALRGECLG